MIRISNIKIGAHKEQKKILEQEICRMLHIKSMQGLSYHIVKKSIDARKKESIQCIYTVDIAGMKDEHKVVAKCKKDNITIAKVLLTCTLELSRIDIRNILYSTNSCYNLEG